MSRPRHKLRHRLALCLMKYLARIPAARRPLLAGMLARIILRLSSRTRKRAINNLALALPLLSDQQRRTMVRQSYTGIIQGLLDCLNLAELEMDIHCDEQAAQYLASGKGLCVVTLHTCCYELVPLALQRLTGRSTTLSHLPKFIDPKHNPYQKAGIGYVEKKQPGAFVKLLNQVKQGAVVTLHADLYAEDINVHFFGRETRAPAGAAMLSAFAGTPLLLAWGVKTKEGRYQVFIEPFMHQPVERNKTAFELVTRKLYERFEQIILSYPEQWYWSFNRWRT
ncbi:lysophospholipid acyltransferase family protein [Bowmanella denitrificans]|uniref:lysophospholipid acyltransferase family protein n=1 Tax=Bowmanella denitrificans TaxID=366582 RepID=UPI000C9CF21C|nr:lysophospholipid acyltransferase family protein [Bowmanella denitrificans]